MFFGFFGVLDFESELESQHLSDRLRQSGCVVFPHSKCKLLSQLSHKQKVVCSRMVLPYRPAYSAALSKCALELNAKYQHLVGNFRKSLFGVAWTLDSANLSQLCAQCNQYKVLNRLDQENVFNFI